MRALVFTPRRRESWSGWVKKLLQCVRDERVGERPFAQFAFQCPSGHGKKYAPALQIVPDSGLSAARRVEIVTSFQKELPRVNA